MWELHFGKEQKLGDSGILCSHHYWLEIVLLKAVNTASSDLLDTFLGY